MKLIIILAILIGIVAPILIYKKDRELKTLLISLLLLFGIVFLGIIGTVMRSLMPLYLLHIVALLFAYISYLIYLIKDRFYWYIYLLPFGTLLFYILLAFIGNRHVSGF